MEPNILYTHMATAAAFAYVMNHLQAAKAIPWVTKDTAAINGVIRALLAFIATIGISWTWSAGTNGGHQLMIAIPSVAVLGHGIFNWFGQYAIQHGWEKVFNVGQTQKIGEQAFNDLVNAITERVRPAVPGGN